MIIREALADEPVSPTFLMTIDEVAAELRVSVPTVRWLRQEGRFAPAIRIGRRLLWDRAVLISWINDHRERASEVRL